MAKAYDFALDKVSLLLFVHSISIVNISIAISASSFTVCPCFDNIFFKYII